MTHRSSPAASKADATRMCVRDMTHSGSHVQYDSQILLTPHLQRINPTTPLRWLICATWLIQDSHVQQDSQILLTPHLQRVKLILQIFNLMARQLHVILAPQRVVAFRVEHCQLPRECLGETQIHVCIHDVVHRVESWCVCVVMFWVQHCQLPRECMRKTQIHVRYCYVVHGEASSYVYVCVWERESVCVCVRVYVPSRRLKSSTTYI